MSQRSVEQVIGKLVTDEALRRRFVKDAAGTLGELHRSGLELNGCELQALLALDPALLSRFAEAIDPRLQKSDLRCGEP
jgi:hypothetical protein